MSNISKYPIFSGIVCLRDFFCGFESSNQTQTEIECFKSNSQKKYTIPFYQRPYEWEWSDEQLRGMFYSLITLPNDEDVDIEIKEGYVVFGTIQLNKFADGYEIIDGQQRLTSFWLLLKAIESKIDDNCSDDINFRLKNHISDEYDSKFINYNKKIENQTNKYNENYLKIQIEIEEILNTYTSDKFNLKLFRESILDHVLFSLMITKYEDDVQKSIQLFDSLNTKGLDLGVKDVFKIKYYEYIKKHADVPVKTIFAKINSAYEKCYDNIEPMYRIGEEDLLDTFKLWIVLNDKDLSKIAKKIKASPNNFFVDDKYCIWQKYQETMSLDSFVFLAETINQVQKIICELDDAGPTEDVTASLLACYELARICGYWYFRNMLFVLANFIRQRKDNSILDKSDVIQVLRLSQYIWKVCSIVKVYDQKVRDEIFKAISGVFISYISTGNSDFVENEMRRFFENENRSIYKDEFVKIIEGDVYNNRQCGFLVNLIYLNDCDNIRSALSWKYQKTKLFHMDLFDKKEKKRKKYEIEHIVSKTFKDLYGNEVHHIGNLFFLTADINKALGSLTSGRDESPEGVEKDFYRKVERNSKHKNYWDDENDNISISAFLKSNQLDENMSYERIREIISKRDKEEQAVLRKIYAVFFDND